MASSNDTHDYVFKILLVGDSGVGKSCLLERFTTDRFQDTTPSTIGVDFKVKFLDVGGQRAKLTIWDTAGQERFRTLTSSYYRGAQGVVFVYDVTKRESFLDLERVWLPEMDMYSTVDDAAKMVVANKVDLAGTRQVTAEEGHDFARKHGLLFVETSAKANIAVAQAFEELVRKITDTPALLNGVGGHGVQLSRGGNSGGGNGSGPCYC